MESTYIYIYIYIVKAYTGVMENGLYIYIHTYIYICIYSGYIRKMEKKMGTMKH